jgi:hypothetical protein
MKKTNFKTITKMAREHMLESGNHMPQLMVFGSEHNTIIAFADFPEDHNIKCRMMAGAGAKIAEDQLKDKALGELEEIYFISEAWMATFKKHEKPVLPVRNNPDRQEVLIIIGKNLKDKSSMQEILNIIRDKEDKVIDLESMNMQKEAEKLAGEKLPEGQQSYESPLLEAFILGHDKMTEILTRKS